jgi:Glycosyl hydrolases family 18
MNRRKYTLRLFVAVATLLGLVIIGRGCIFRPATGFSGAHFNKGSNAVWLGVEWVNEPHDESEIAALARDLRGRQIRYVYAYTSYLKPDGEFNQTYAHAAEFIRTLKASQPDLNVQAWIGLPLKQADIFGSGYVNLGEATAQQQIAAFCADLIQTGFDGIHLDPEPIPSGDANVLALLQEVRRAIGPDATLSIATPRIWPIFPERLPPFIGAIAWDADYYGQIAQRVDQVAVMVYDSGLPWPELYRLWGRFQVIQVTRAVDGTDAKLLFGVPASEEKTFTHWPNAENMTSGLRGVIDGLNDADARPFAVTGVAVYPDWETDAAEWATYESLWLGR